MENGVLRKAKDFAKKNVVITQLRQRRPVTIVDAYLITDFPGGRRLGFSDWAWTKVCWPDHWDPEEGKTKAREKAAALIAKKMVAAGWEPGFAKSE